MTTQKIITKPQPKLKKNKLTIHIQNEKKNEQRKKYQKKIYWINKNKNKTETREQR